MPNCRQPASQKKSTTARRADAMPAWREAAFALYLAEEKIEPEVVANMRSWPHSEFHVDQSVYLPAGDRAGVQRSMQYMTRCPFSLSRLVKVTKTGEVVYKAEKDSCRASQTWAKLIKRGYEVDPLACPKCGGELNVVSFIFSRQPGPEGGGLPCAIPA